MTDLTLPYDDFVSGTTIVSAQVDANFDAIKDIINTTGVPLVQDGTVSGGKLASTMTGARTWSGINTFSVATVQAVQAFTATDTISASAGEFVTFTGSSGQTLTLPAAVVGQRFTIDNIDSADSVTVARAGSDTINGGTTISIPSAFRATLHCVAAATWIASFEGRGRNQYGSYVAGSHTPVGYIPAVINGTSVNLSVANTD